MLENLRRKSLVKTYNDPIYQVHFEQGLARYRNHVEIDVCNQRLSKELQESLFQKAIGMISKETFSFFKLTMICCPSGSFMMGNKNRKYDYEEKHIDKSFMLSDAEISQELYEKVMGNNPSKHFQHPKNPVVYVSWLDAIAFCNELSELQGLEKCYTPNNHNFADYGWDCDSSKNGYRLPTEMEWEYAAKAGTENQYAGTDDANQLGEYAWFSENSNSQIHPIKTKKPNEWGFYDMSGNVSEWCWDRFYDTYTHMQKGRVTRSSKFNSRLSLLDISIKWGNDPTTIASNLGFRIARTITK